MTLVLPYVYCFHDHTFCGLVAFVIHILYTYTSYLIIIYIISYKELLYVTFYVGLLLCVICLRFPVKVT